jgi:hypothetical protein
MSTKGSMKRIAEEYFRRLDAKDPTITELFADNFTFLYPGFGVGRGRDQFAEVMTAIGNIAEKIIHDSTDYIFIEGETHLAVEGTTSGVTASGFSWTAGSTEAGRFCNIFEIRDGLIARLHVYLDPSFLRTTG